jgi:hypothetical protein
MYCACAGHASRDRVMRRKVCVIRQFLYFPRRLFFVTTGACTCLVCRSFPAQASPFLHKRCLSLPLLSFLLDYYFLGSCSHPAPILGIARKSLTQWPLLVLCGAIPPHFSLAWFFPFFKCGKKPLFCDPGAVGKRIQALGVCVHPQDIPSGECSGVPTSVLCRCKIYERLGACVTLTGF